MMSEINDSKAESLKAAFRFILVLITWFVVAIIPDNSGSFYQTIIVASMTTLYEYVIIYLDSKYKARDFMATIGIGLSALYLFGAFLGFCNLIVYNVTSHYFSLSGNFPLPHSPNFHWGYFPTIIPMFCFPGLVLFDFIIKPNDSGTKATKAA